MEGNGKLSQRYLSGRVKVSNNTGLSTTRHRYLSPSEAEPKLGFVGEKTLPASVTYYKLVTVPNGNVYDRYWQPDLPATLVNVNLSDLNPPSDTSETNCAFALNPA